MFGNAAVQHNSADGYDLMGDFVEAVYGADIHYGYWDGDPDATPLAVAQERLTDVVVATLALVPGRRVLDIGCGTGGLARRVRLTTGADVTGVTVSAWEAEEATRRAVAAGLTEGVRFQQADVTALPFPAAAFEAALTVEVLVHVSDKRRALSEIRRVLPSGGRIVLAEPVKRTPLTAVQSATWFSMRMAPVPTLDQYLELLAEAGFGDVVADDLTEAVRPSFAHLKRGVRQGATALADRYPAQLLKRVGQIILDVQSVAEACHGYRVFTATAS